MAYSELLADRIRRFLTDSKSDFVELRMMGGLCFMVDDKMCMGINGDQLMARIGKENYEEALTKEGCSPMDFTKRPLRGFVYVSPQAIDSDEDLDAWLQLCLDYNPLAKSSKKKKKRP